MSEMTFPLKDLARRKSQTALTLVGLTISTAATVFLVLFGENLGFEISVVTGGKLTTGFSSVFSLFIVMVGVLNVLVGALVTSFLVHLSMSERAQDIGIMKASGCVTSLAFGFFVTELSIIIFVSCIVGTISGVVMYFSCTNALHALGFPITTAPINWWMILFIFLVFVVASHILGTHPIFRVIRMKPADALSPSYSVGTVSEGPRRPASSKLGLALKVAYRVLRRRSIATVLAVVCLAAVFTLTTVTLAGGTIANQTTQSYVERAVGRDIVMVAHANVSQQYVSLLSQFIEGEKPMPINYLDQRYHLPESLISNLSAIRGVLQVDPRLVFEATVHEVQGIILDPEGPERYIRVGDHRTGDALVLGVRPERVVNEWLVWGRVLNETDTYSAIVGDSLASKMFEDPMKQAIIVGEAHFEIAGICLDPLNNGNVVYVPLNAWEQSSCNLLFLKIDQANRGQVIAELQNQVSGLMVEALELNIILDNHLDFLGYIWSFVMLLPLFSLATAVLCLLSYLMLSITSQQKQFGIMRALGAQPRAILKIVLTEALIITLVSGAIGIVVGLFFTFVFLIPEPIISLFTLVSVAGWLLLALGILGLSSLYPARKAMKKPIVDVLSQP